MLLRDVPSLLYAAARLGPWVIISLHAFLHAILDQSSRVWRAQLSSLSFNSIHSITHNAIKSFIMSSTTPTPSNPYRLTPASSKAASSIRSGRVVLHPPEAIDATRPSNKRHAHTAFAREHDDDDIHFVGAITAASVAVASPLAKKQSLAAYPIHACGTKPPNAASVEQASR